MWCQNYEQNETSGLVKKDREKYMVSHTVETNIQLEFERIANVYMQMSNSVANWAPPCGEASRAPQQTSQNFSVQPRNVRR